MPNPLDQIAMMYMNWKRKKSRNPVAYGSSVIYMYTIFFLPLNYLFISRKAGGWNLLFPPTDVRHFLNPKKAFYHLFIGETFKEK